MAPKQPSHIATVGFLDGPWDGKTLNVSDPPPEYLKMGMPEWAVYRYDGEQYVLQREGLAARQWRNPERSIFVPSDPEGDGDHHKDE